MWSYIGIDQTGATNSKGVPKPLASCLIKNREVRFFYLPSLSADGLLENAKTKNKNQMLVCIDCVLGLPQDIDITFADALKKILNTEGFGQRAASDYFFKIGKGKIPKRKVEQLCRANSVFTNRPFQKNIQTGTFRCWKELALNQKQFSFPALHKKNKMDQIKVYEGYPSLSWKLLLHSPTRDVKNLSRLIKKYFPEILWTPHHQKQVNRDKNLADAFVLSLTLWQLGKSISQIKPNKEGWILGL